MLHLLFILSIKVCGQVFAYSLATAAPLAVCQQPTSNSNNQCGGFHSEPTSIPMLPLAKTHS